MKILILYTTSYIIMGIKINYGTFNIFLVLISLFKLNKVTLNKFGFNSSPKYVVT